MEEQAGVLPVAKKDGRPLTPGFPGCSVPPGTRDLKVRALFVSTAVFFLFFTDIFFNLVPLYNTSSVALQFIFS